MTESPGFRDSRALNRQMVKAMADGLDLARFAQRSMHAGQILAASGARLDALPLIVSGTVAAAVHVGPEGNVVIPISFEAGELAMVSMLFSDKPSHVELIASSDGELRWIPVANIEHCLLQDRDCLLLLVRFLAQRLREVQSRERVWLGRGVSERVCAAIARAMRDVPRRGDGTCMLETTHEALAARSGVSRPKLSMELKRLEQSGLLALHRGAIEVVRPAHFSDAD